MHARARIVRDRVRLCVCCTHTAHIAANTHSSERATEDKMTTNEMEECEGRPKQVTTSKRKAYNVNHLHSSQYYVMANSKFWNNCAIDIHAFPYTKFLVFYFVFVFWERNDEEKIRQILLMQSKISNGTYK